MQYDNNVTDKIDLINSVFNKINVSPLLENEDFSVSSLYNNKDVLVLNLVKKNTIELEILIAKDSLLFGIDRVYEAYEVTNKYITEKKKEVADFIEMLFTYNIKVKYCGSNYTKILFINNNGEVVDKIIFITGFYLKIKCKIKDYSPIYDVENNK